MTPYEIMIKTNEDTIKGKIFSEDEKREISKALLQAVCEENTVEGFQNRINTSSSDKGKTAKMYPIFYYPPYNEVKKYPILTGVTPKTKILSANAYELEILRILALFDGGNEKVKYMLYQTKERLSRTCFGRFCETGECFDTSLIVLRFIATAFPEETELQQNLLHGIKAHFQDKKRHSGIVFYYRLILSELTSELALPEIYACKDTLLQQLVKSYVMNSDNDKYVNTLDKYILRNCLSRLPEFDYIKEREPFISEKDGRLYFTVTANIE